MKTRTLWVAALGMYVAGCSAGGGAPAGPARGAGGGSFASGGVGGAGPAFDAGGSADFTPAFGSGGADGTGGAGSGGAAAPPPTPTPGPVDIDECTTTNRGNLDATTVQKLLAGGGAGGLRLLNPYDGTVLPRGLLAPAVMWDGAPADAVYLHLHSGLFDYKGCLAPTGPGQVQIPEEIWKQASAQTRGATDPFTLELTVSSGGAVVGPVSEKLVIAQATLKGSIFYNSYSSKLVSGLGEGGAVLRISPGKQAVVVLGQQGCTACHSVSANGARLTALAFLQGGASYTVAPGTGDLAPLSPTAPGTDFTALYPDGSLYVTNAHQGFPVVGPRTGPTNLGAGSAGVYDTTTGAAIAGTGVPATAMTPAFSSDGTLLAFADYAINAGHGLAIVNFDGPSRKASGYRTLFQSATAAYPAWPFVIPDDTGVVYALGALSDFSGGAAGITAGVTPATAPASDLYVVDLASGQPRLLAQAMGFASEQAAASNTTYLPFGAAEEAHHNYYPTMSPVAAGGYFWVFFDSFRHYGSLGLGRQLWGTAIDISPDGHYATDPSHPAFFITGQELGTANHRAFTALDPCKKDGEGCETGVDCCGGFCTNQSCGLPPPPPAVPGEPPPPPPCAHTDERCKVAADCCNMNDRCIAGFCSLVLR